MSDSDDYNNLQNISDTDLDAEIEMRQYALTHPAGNQSMRTIIQNRLNLLLAERRRRQRRTKMTTRKRGGRNHKKSRNNKKLRKNK